MSILCRHVDKTTCKLKSGGRCIFIIPDEKKCSDEEHGIIHYLKHLGTYHMVENDPKFTDRGEDKMIRAEETRKLAERNREASANDYYYNTLEKDIALKIKVAAEAGRLNITITQMDALNLKDRWMDNTEVLALLKMELEKLGYKYAYNNDRDSDWITISW